MFSLTSSRAAVRIWRRPRQTPATRLSNRAYQNFAKCCSLRRVRNSILFHRCCTLNKMKRKESQYNLNKEASRSARLLSDSMSSDEPETERLLNLQQPPIVMAMGSGRRQSLTAPPSPTDYRKKRDGRHNNYRNHLHHLIHWRDIWGSEPQKPQEVVKTFIFCCFVLHFKYSHGIRIMTFPN